MSGRATPGRGDSQVDYVALYLHPWDNPRNEVNKFGRTPGLVRESLVRTRARILDGGGKPGPLGPRRFEIPDVWLPGVY